MQTRSKTFLATNFSKNRNNSTIHIARALMSLQMDANMVNDNIASNQQTIYKTKRQAKVTHYLVLLLRNRSNTLQFKNSHWYLSSDIGNFEMVLVTLKWFPGEINHNLLI